MWLSPLAHPRGGSDQDGRRGYHLLVNCVCQWSRSQLRAVQELREPTGSGLPNGLGSLEEDVLGDVGGRG
jgi:hypothetical protein